MAVGVAAMIFWQVFENIGMVIGLLPVTGITLPLMSYGGSSMMSILLSLGLLANISHAPAHVLSRRGGRSPGGSCHVWSALRGCTLCWSGGLGGCTLLSKSLSRRVP